MMSGYVPFVLENDNVVSGLMGWWSAVSGVLQARDVLRGEHRLAPQDTDDTMLPNTAVLPELKHLRLSKSADMAFIHLR